MCSLGTVVAETVKTEAETEMGSFAGHIDEAIFFLLLAAWWMYNKIPNYVLVSFALGTMQLQCPEIRAHEPFHPYCAQKRAETKHFKLSGKIGG